MAKESGHRCSHPLDFVHNKRHQPGAECFRADGVQDGVDYRVYRQDDNSHPGISLQNKGSYQCHCFDYITIMIMHTRIRLVLVLVLA